MQTLRTHLFPTCARLAAATLLGYTAVSAATINLASGDGFGQSSFASGTNWPGAAAPVAGNDYVVGAGLRLRTPEGVANFTGSFAGDSLTIQNGFSTGNMNGTGSSDLFGFTYKSTAAAGAVTVDNLILDAGAINHLNGAGDLFNLYGNINVLSTSSIRAKQGPIHVYSTIQGSADLYIGASDGGGVRTVHIHSGANTFTGNHILSAASSQLTLSSTGLMNFVIGANGVNNMISGSGVATLNGTFVFDLTNASTTPGDSWAVVTSTTRTFGVDFQVSGFSGSGNLWSNGGYEFDTSTGILTAVPEPSAWAAVAGLLALGTTLARRRR